MGASCRTCDGIAIRLRRVVSRWYTKSRASHWHLYLRSSKGNFWPNLSSKLRIWCSGRLIWRKISMRAFLRARKMMTSLVVAVSFETRKSFRSPMRKTNGPPNQLSWSTWSRWSINGLRKHHMSACLCTKSRRSSSWTRNENWESLSNKKKTKLIKSP